MPAKIRLQRKGKKGRAFYHIVIADGRAPRDGRLVEKIGSYDPMTNPATIELDFDKALHWVQVGAQPTDTTRAILSYRGVMYKNHLLKGVKKGALTEEKAEVLFKEWLEAKEAKIANKAKGLEDAVREDRKKKLAAEAEVNEARKAEFAKKKADEQAAIEAELAAKAAEKAKAEEEKAAAAEAKEEKTENDPIAETKEEAKEEVKEEAKEEAKEETKEEAKEEAKEETREEAREEAKEETKEEAREETKEETKKEKSE